jgi:pimeloyl-ACP methyl ester carboxylesterase
MSVIRNLLRTLVVSTAFAHGAAAAAAQPCVVIVHGAFADGSDWSKVIALLQAKGITVTAVQNPLTSLADDVASAERAIELQKGPVVLVGHSWGGTVITEAGKHDKVAALVYVAAFAPDVGQTSNGITKPYPVPPGIAKLVPDRQGFLRLPDDALRDDFAQDVPPEQARIMAATQGPVQGKAFDEKVSHAAWKSKHSWYIVSTQDRMIQPELQRVLARQMKAKTTELAASHVPQQSKPADVARVIMDAVAAAAR